MKTIIKLLRKVCIFLPSKTQYQTRHRQELLAYLQFMAGQHVTAAGIAQYFESQGIRIGIATIYRHLDRMVAEGIINKYVLDNTSPACYEYHAPTTEHTESGCLHLKCECCNAVIHLPCHELAQLQHHLLQQYHFTLNGTRTVLYGLCENCRKDSAQSPGSDFI